jgi:hypothetical protein
MEKTIDFSLEIKECVYKGEHYSAREDGAIMRHRRKGMVKRKLDEIWSFGKQNVSTGYMDFCGERVHRIVATAFHGHAPSEQHVVDHIDTNRCNNRPENLRWLTKLENILCNDITRKKVELICGSIVAFLENPQLLYGYETEDSNFKWMKNVTKEEAKNCLENWQYWAKTIAPDPNYKRTEHRVDERIYTKQSHSDDNPFLKIVPDGHGGYKMVDTQTPSNTLQEEIEAEEEIDYLFDSLTPIAKQRYWKTPTKFPSCPNEVTTDGLNNYMSNLKVGSVFSSNVYDSYFVVDKGFNKDNTELYVLTTNNKDNMISWAISTITIKNGFFVHENTKATAGKELTEKFFKALTGREKMSIEDFEFFDCL